jgi:hypothetical protein
VDRVDWRKETRSFEKGTLKEFAPYQQKAQFPSFQHGALESRSTWMSPDASLRAWMPAIHAGITEKCRPLPAA